MSWLLVLLVAWVAVAFGLAMILGAAVRLADTRRPRAAAAAGQTPPPVPGQPSDGDRTSTAGLPAVSIVILDEPVRPRTAAMDSDPSLRRMAEARPVIVRQRQAH
jgi:hypothetical protein